jgi:glycosyltransferase involved in cell wall biosynthesis
MTTAPSDVRPLDSLPVDRPLNVVHLVLTLNIGGLEKVVYDLVRPVEPDRFKMRVLCLDEIGALGPTFERIGVPVEGLGVHAKGPLHGILSVARRLRKLQPDVLHTHNAAAHIVGAPAARWSRVPVVVHTRHGLYSIHGWRTNLANRMATWLTDRVVAVSGSAAEVSRTVDGVPASRLAVIRNGVDLCRYRQRAHRTAGAVWKAIHAARLVYPAKDQRTLLRAARLVVDKRPDFRIDIVGDGPDRPTLEELRDKLQLQSQVRFLGFRHDVQDLLAEADLFVLSSTTEGLPITILEAMAAGLPIVSTDAGGIPEVVAHGQTGLLVPPQSPADLAAAILELMRDPQRAAEMGSAGRRHVENECDIRAVKARYEDLYRTLLRKNHP